MFAATADELLTAWRDDVDDVVAPYLWSNAAAYRYMTAVCDMVATRTRQLFKQVNLNFAAGATSVSLPNYVLEIREAQLVGGPVLRPLNLNRTVGGIADDYGYSAGTMSAFDQPEGTPRFYVRDADIQALRLVPRPAEAGDLQLHCLVTIAEPMANGVPLPFSTSEDLLLVLEGMKALAYRKQDAEAEDLVRANAHARIFEAGLTEREWRVQNHRRAPGVVRTQGW